MLKKFLTAAALGLLLVGAGCAQTSPAAPAATNASETPALPDQSQPAPNQALEPDYQPY